jgi:hypothetical protein
MKTRIQTKRANKHNRLSCLISTSISVHSMLFSNYQNCRYVVYKFVNCVVWFVTSLFCHKFVASLLQVCHKFVASLSQVCCKFVTSLHSQTQTNAPTSNINRVRFIGWLMNRIYNKQQYNDHKVSIVVSSQLNI